MVDNDDRRSAAAPDMPAVKMGLRPGRRDRARRRRRDHDGAQLVDTIHGAPGKRCTLVVRRGDQTLTVVGTPVSRELAGKRVGLLGFARASTQRAGLARPRSACGRPFWFFIVMQLGVLAALVTVRACDRRPRGPDRHRRNRGQVQNSAGGRTLTLAAQLSISLGIFNLLPIPALDGGRGAFIIAEMLRGKPVDPEKEALVHVAGFAALWS